VKIRVICGKPYWALARSVFLRIPAISAGNFKKGNQMPDFTLSRQQKHCLRCLLSRRCIFEYPLNQAKSNRDN